MWPIYDIFNSWKPRILNFISYTIIIGIALTAVILLPIQMACSSGGGRICYVSSSKGSDSNDGLSSRKPWRTLAKVNSFDLMPGDSVLLKRGDVWRETLNPKSPGSEGHEIVIGSYGKGPRPRILGSTAKTGATNWVEESPNIWYTSDITSAPKMIFHSGLGSINKKSKDFLDNDWDWCYDVTQGRIYYCLDENPGNYNIEIPQRNGVGFSLVNYIIIKNIEIAYADFGVALWGANSWIIYNLYVHDITIDAIHCNNASTNITVYKSIFQDWGWQGYKLPFGSNPETSYGYGIHILDTISSGSSNCVITNNSFNNYHMQSDVDNTAIAIDIGGHASLISNNIIQGNNATNGGGIRFWRPIPCTDTIISGNIIKNVGSIGIDVSELAYFGFLNKITIDGNTIVNSCSHDKLDTEALRIWTSNLAQIVARNNIINGTFDGNNIHPGLRVRNSQQSILDGNTIYNTDVGISLESGSHMILLINNTSTSNRIYNFIADSTSTYILN